MAFDLEGARKAGYSDAEIADHLAQESKFDLAGARSSGYSDAEIISHLAVRPKTDKPADESFLQKTGHLAGVANKAIVDNLPGLVLAPADLATKGYNALHRGYSALNQAINPYAPTTAAPDLPLPSASYREGVNQINQVVPFGADPQTAGEHLLAAGVGGATNALGSVGLGQALASANNPVVSGVGNILAQNPIVQSVSGGSAGASGELAKQQGIGPTGQALASLAGGLLGGGLAMPFSKTPPIEPTPPSNPGPAGEYQKAVSALDEQGIPLTTGQRSGTNWIKATERGLAEVPLGGKPIQNAFEDQARAYQAALLRQAGNASGDNMVTRETLDRTRSTLGQKYAEALSNKSLNLSDEDFINNLAAIETKHTQMLPFEQKQQVKQIINDFLDKAAALKSEGKGLSGEDYQRLRSTLGQKAAGTQNSYISGLYSDLKGAVDDLFGRTAGPDKFNIDSQYARLKQLQSIYERTGGPAASEGFISPVQVAREAAGAPGGVDWQDFTRNAAAVLPDRIGNSGTAQRHMIMNMLMGGGAITHPGATALGVGTANLLARGLASGKQLPSSQTMAQALIKAGYPASIAALQQQ